MKKYLFAFLLCLFTISAFSQLTLSAGPAAGANYPWVSDISGDYERNVGLLAGVQLTHSDIRNWGIGAGVFYSSEGVISKVGNEEFESELKYVRIPLKGYIFFRKLEDDFRPKIFLGPTFGFLVGGDTEVPQDGNGKLEIDSKDIYNTFDLGLLGGLGINIRIGDATWFNFDAGYTYGLLDVAESEAEGANRNVFATVGVAFGL